MNCSTRQSLASAPNAYSGGVMGGATSLVYGPNGPAPGWGFNSWKLNWGNLTLPAGGTSVGLSGSGNRNATCDQISGAGGLIGFFCHKCRDVFSDAVQISIREAQQLSGNPTGGAVPPLRLTVSRRDYHPTAGVGGVAEEYCDNKPQLSDKYKTGSRDGYTQCVLELACARACVRTRTVSDALALRAC